MVYLTMTMTMTTMTTKPFFFVFKFLHTHTVNTSYITIYVCEGKLCRTKILWVLKFEQVGEFHKKFQNPPSRMIF